MTSLKLLLLAATALAAPAAPALAQTATPAPATAQNRPADTQETPEDEATTVDEVTVTARATDVRASIDSVSYSLADDLQATTGSLADALRNVPSVDVDPQGNVSLRGDGNVTILVDGRPSGVLSGEGRAQALQQMQAGQYARIEVMTNPSAAYSPEGSGGVINLITRPNQPRPGTVSTGSLSANVGDDGRWNLGFSGSRTSGALTLSGNLGVRHDTGEQVIRRERERLDTASGRFLPSTQDQNVDFASDGYYGDVGLEYRLTDKTQLTLEARGGQFDNTGDGTEQFEARDVAGGVASSYRRDSDIEQGWKGYGATVRVLHQFDDAGHEWSNEVQFDRGENSLHQNSTTTPGVPAGPTAFERVTTDSPFTRITLKSAYVRPIGEMAKLRLGYELEMRQPEQDNVVRRGTPTGLPVVVPGLTNRFEADQTVHALYATWERPFGEKLSAQFGLRLEQADIEVNSITSGVHASQDYFRAYPTLHLQYQLAETQTLRGSYSRRIQRPAPFQLNPFVAYVDPLNLRSGNATLEPQETDAFELQWQMRAGQTFYQATAYYRDTTRAFTEIATDVGGGVLLTRPENLGARRDTGVEAVANGRLTSTLRYNASINVYRSEIDASGIPGATDRSDILVSGRLNLNWQPTPEDFVQLSGQWNGDALLAQGTRESRALVNLGYRRKLTETVAFQLTVRDLFDEAGDVITYDTPTFRDRTDRTFGGRAGYVGLTWTFGSSPRRPQDPQFDFQGPQTGG
ncbi:TonB-dependent receptor domain-containing protein [Brevundimonas sp.]|uniref:TonB-dependent receptor domain-containing protein n=1 Tax=Brevundimonas sp. TaxID=1871086 RepID=UPI003D0B4A79